MGHKEAVTAAEPTNKTKAATVPIGLYHIWTERDGKPTSPTDAWFQIVGEDERIRICETR